MMLPDCTRFMYLAQLQDFTLEVTQENSLGEENSGTSQGKFRLVLIMEMKKHSGEKNSKILDSSKPTQGPQSVLLLPL